MITRYGDAAQAQTLNRDLLSTQNRMRETQLQVSSGKAARRYDQIAGDASFLVRTKEHRTLIQGYVAGNREVVDRLNAMDGAVRGLGEGAERLRSLLVQRLDAAAGSAVPLDSEIESLLGEVEHQLNIRLDDRSLFAGSRTDVDAVQIPDPPPTVADAALYYQGDDMTPTHRADTDLEIPLGVKASHPAFAQLVAALGEGLAAHQANDRDGLENALDQVTVAIDGLADLRGTLGARAERVTSIANGQDAQLDYLAGAIGDIEDVDLAEAMTKLAQDRTVLEASYLAISQINGLSLADYLR